MLAGCPLLPHAIVTEKRAASLTFDVCLTHEGDVFVASNGEKHANTERGAQPEGAGQDAICDRLPVALVGLMNQPGDCRGRCGAIELGPKPLHDPPAIERQGTNDAWNDGARSARVEACNNIAKLVAQIGECGSA